MVGLELREFGGVLEEQLSETVTHVLFDKRLALCITVRLYGLQSHSMHVNCKQCIFTCIATLSLFRVVGMLLVL